MVATLNIFIIIFPAQSLAAARSGLVLWAQSVLPGVLPFVVGANMLVALGAAGLLGTALAPVMRGIFKIPGAGGFALAVGLISGYPVGAKVVCEMRLQGDLTRMQAQRLAAFANNAGPLFILGAVAVGMFGNSHLGYFILAVHYMGAVAVGFCMRFYGAKKEREEKSGLENRRTINRDNRGFGQIFGQAVMNAVEPMLLVGGFIVLFSVISAILSLSGAYDAVSVLLTPVLDLLNIPKPMHTGFLAGLVEMTNGLAMIGDHGINRITVAISSGIISFGGLSVLFQSINFIGKTDINVPLYVACKLAHGVFSAIFALVLYPFFTHVIESPRAIAVYSHGAASRLAHSTMYFAIIMAVLAAISATTIILKTIRKNRGI